MLEAVQANSRSLENDQNGRNEGRGGIKSYKDVSTYTYTYIERGSMLYSHGYRVYTCPMDTSDYLLYNRPGWFQVAFSRDLIRMTLGREIS